MVFNIAFSDQSIYIHNFFIKTLHNVTFISGCAYKKGICAMCGKKIINTTNYRQSST